MCVYINTLLHMCISSVHVCICAYISTLIYVFVYACVYINTLIYIHLQACVYVCVCRLCRCLHFTVSVYELIVTYVFVYVFVCVCVYVHMCTLVY